MVVLVEVRNWPNSTLLTHQAQIGPWLSDIYRLHLNVQRVPFGASTQYERTLLDDNTYSLSGWYELTGTLSVHKLP